MVTKHTLLYLECQQMVTKVKQHQRKKSSTRVEQPLNDVHEDLTTHKYIVHGVSVGVTQLQHKVKQLPMKGLCVGITKLQPKDMDWSWTTPREWMLFIGGKQIPKCGRIKFGLDNSKWDNVIELKDGKNI